MCLIFLLLFGWRINKDYSILFYSILFYSILFYSILFYSILFYSILIIDTVSLCCPHINKVWELLTFSNYM